nr:MAG TPA: hypothetical protein [Caudoviricetes sp.]
MEEVCKANSSYQILNEIFKFSNILKYAYADINRFTSILYAS